MRDRPAAPARRLRRRTRRVWTRPLARCRGCRAAGGPMWHRRKLIA